MTFFPKGICRLYIPTHEVHWRPNFAPLVLESLLDATKCFQSAGLGKFPKFDIPRMKGSKETCEISGFKNCVKVRGRYLVLEFFGGVNKYYIRTYLDLPGVCKCVPFHPKNIPKGRDFTYMEDPDVYIYIHTYIYIFIEISFVHFHPPEALTLGHPGEDVDGCWEAPVPSLKTLEENVHGIFSAMKKTPWLFEGFVGDEILPQLF